MLTLFQFPPLFGLPNASPFCLKVETFLRFHEIPYETRMVGDMRKAPKGKLPYIRDEQTVIADSTFILDYLINTRKLKVDRHLQDDQRAVQQAFCVMLEERFYWAMVYTRWVGPNWEENRVQLARVMPPIVRNIVPPLIQRQLRADIKSQGLGRHGPDELYELASRDIDAVAAYLDRKPWFFGEQPSTADIVIYSFLGNAWLDNQESPLKTSLARHTALVAYLERLHQLWYATD